MEQILELAKTQLRKVACLTISVVILFATLTIYSFGPNVASATTLIATWGSPTEIYGGFTNHISCSTSNFCVFTTNLTSSNMSQIGATLSYNGSSWTPTQPIDETGGTLTAVSCPTTTFCVAVDNFGNEITYSGSSWLSAQNVDGTNKLTDISCTSNIFCVAVDNKGNEITYNGSSWLTPQNIDSGATLSVVSCPTSTFCIAVNFNGGALTFNGSIWSAPQDIDGFVPITAVSCPTTSFCVAVDFNGDALTYNGSIWSAPQDIDFSRILTSLSCPTTTFCVAVDNYGNEVTYSGSSWLSPQNIDPGDSITSVSCASSLFCVTIDYYGNAVIYAPLPLYNVTSVFPSNGPTSGGTTVKISGNNLSGTSAVYFGSTLASSFTVISDTEITAVSPAVSLPATVDITVATSSGTSSTDTNDQFTFGQQTYNPITPTRICDTRPVQPGVAFNQCNDGLAALKAIQPGHVINVNLTSVEVGNPDSQFTLPQNTTAVILNITAANATANGGFLTVYPTGSLRPNSSNLNFNDGATVPNLVQVGIGLEGDISIYNFNGNTNVIVDLEGYFVPTTSTNTSGQFVAISPNRICDTRPVQPGVVSNQCNNGTSTNGALAPNSTINIQVVNTSQSTIQDGVPNNAEAIVLNITAVDPTSAGGYLTVFPTASGSNLPPTASNLNFNAYQTIANRVTVPIGLNGEVSIYNYNGTTNVIVDVNGYFLSTNASSSASAFTPINPVRICDTRPISSGTASNQCDNGTATTGTMTQGQIISVSVGGSSPVGILDNVPSDATAVVLNVTATDTSAPGGFLTVYPTPLTLTSPPNVSDLNWNQSNTVANLVVVMVGNNTSINIYNAIGSADVIIDVMGYYAPP